MPLIERALALNGTPGSIWQVLSDLENWAQWLEHRTFLSKYVFWFQLEEGSTMGPGARIVVQMTRASPKILIVREWEPPRRFLLQSAELAQSGEPVFELSGTISSKTSILSEVYLRLSFNIPSVFLSDLMEGFLTLLGQFPSAQDIVEKKLNVILEDVKKLSA